MAGMAPPQRRQGGRPWMGLEWGMACCYRGLNRRAASGPRGSPLWLPAGAPPPNRLCASRCSCRQTRGAVRGAGQQFRISRPLRMMGPFPWAPGGRKQASDSCWHSRGARGAGAPGSWPVQQAAHRRPRGHCSCGFQLTSSTLWSRARSLKSSLKSPAISLEAPSGRYPAAVLQRWGSSR